MPDTLPDTLIVIIGGAQQAQIHAAAAGAYPRECCGLLVGRRTADGWLVSEVVPTENRAGDPHRSFEIDPARQFALLHRLRAMPEGGLAVIGHYHSHPDAEARPSPRDRLAANDPAMIWLIIGVAAGQPGPLSAWRVVMTDDAQPDFLPISLISSDAGLDGTEKA